MEAVKIRAEVTDMGDEEINAIALCTAAIEDRIGRGDLDYKAAARVARYLAAKYEEDT